MKNYIFITTEGFTYQPNSESNEPDIENCQVIGYGHGENAKRALDKMIKQRDFLLETSFNEITAIEIRAKSEEYFCLSNFK